MVFRMLIYIEVYKMILIWKSEQFKGFEKVSNEKQAGLDVF